MPAAPLRERRGSSRSRTAASVDRARPRAPRSAKAAPAKSGRAKGAPVNWRLIGASALALTLIAATTAILATGGRGQKVLEAASRVADGARYTAADLSSLLGNHFAGLGFTIQDIHLQGASRASQAEILAAAAIRPGAPIFDLDLAAVRARVEQVGWVEHARVIRLLPATVVIAVDERPLMAIWEHAGRRDVVARDGRVVSAVDPAHFRQLPKVIGPGANTEAYAFLPLLDAHPRLAGRIQAIRRVDGRRWDLLLTSGATVMLPDLDAAGALATLDELDRQGRVLSLPLERIDLRKPGFTVVRPRAAATGDTTTTKTHGV